VGAFHGTVAISGKTVTLTSGSRVFDPLWQAFMPAIAGRRSLDVIGSGTDSARLTLMAPAPDGPDQTVSLTSQLNYVTGVIEVTFTSPPGAGVLIVVSYNAEPSQWNGEHKVISATSKSVTYSEPNCTAAGASAASGEAYALPLIYVAPASHTNCAYDGDGGQACTPSDSNSGATKPHPKATLAGATQLLKSRVLTVPYMIQLADANGTGLGGSTPLTDCYQPNEVTFSAVTIGGAPVDENEQLRVDRFPQSYLWVHGSAHPEMVLINGSGDCAASSRAVGPSEALRFDHMAARVDGFSLQGYGNRIGRGLGPSGISFVNFATGYVENMICTGARDLNPKFFTQCVGAWDHSTLKVGGSHVVRNADWIRAVNQSNLFTADPSDQTGQNTTLDYFSSTPGAAMACTIMSNCQIDHLTAKFRGPGSYTAQSATEKSAFYYAERYVGSQCPNAACFDITIDAPNMTWESSVLGGHVDSSCANSQQGVCTVISGPAVRAYAQEDSFIKEYGASVIKGPDVEAAGGCVEVWNFSWQTPPGSQPPTCSSLVIRSESKLWPPLTLQNASESKTALLELKTGTGALAASFSASGQIATINSVATTGNGFGAEVYSNVPTATNRGIPATTMFTPTTDGNFTARFYLSQVDAGAGCTTPAAVAVQVTYTDPDFGVAQPLTFVATLSAGGGAVSTALNLTADTTQAHVATGSVFFRARGSAPIRYATNYTNGDCATQPRYRIVSLLQWF
jgi:hypothetical protein